MADKTVLVIDDDVHVRRVIQVKLKGRGYKVIMAKDGEQGLEMIRTEKPDAVVTDINMPKVDGQALCMETDLLKKDRSFLTIVMTARISPEEQEWVDRMIDTKLLKKPFSPSGMLRIIDEYFHTE